MYEQGQLFPVREQTQSSDAEILVGTPVVAATVVNLDLISDLTEDQSVVILLRMNDLRVSDLVSITVMLVLTAWRTRGVHRTLTPRSQTLFYRLGTIPVEWE